MTGIALLTAINTYPNSPLRGCVNDAKNMGSLLRDQYDMDLDVVRTCLDFRATTHGMLDRIKEWVVNAPLGAWSMWHHSGHGSTYPRLLEADGRGECICPVDYDGSPDRMITDETLCDILRLKHPDSKLLIVLDTCFSGGMDRSEQLVSPREHDGVTLADVLLPCERDSEVSAADRRYRYIRPPDRGTGKITSSIVSQLPPNVIVLAGAGEDQTGADAFIDHRYQGAFSFFLVSALRLGLVDSLQALIDVVAWNLSRNGFSQVPGLKGDLALFGAAFMSEIG